MDSPSDRRVRNRQSRFCLRKLSSLVHTNISDTAVRTDRLGLWRSIDHKKNDIITDK